MPAGTGWRHNRRVATVDASARARFIRLAHRQLGLRRFLQAADSALRRAIGYDSSCWLSLDPATLLPTSHFTHEVAGDHLLELAHNEFTEDDVNKFAELSRSDEPVATLRRATGGEPTRSVRFARVLVPHGYGDGDELRAVFRAGETAWGCVALHRRIGEFTDREVSTVAQLAPFIGEGIRRAVVMGGPAPADGQAPGMLIIDAAGRLEGASASAELWLAELVDSTSSGAVPLIITGLAGQARRTAEADSEVIAHARIPRKSGGWLLADAAPLDGEPVGRVAVVLQPATDPEIAPLIAEAHGLTRRERAVTGLVLRGYSTAEIAERLAVSPHTVQDYLKSVFTKAGVRSRRELVAQVFLQHYAPHLEAGQRIGADGSFLSFDARLAPSKH